MKPRINIATMNRRKEVTATLSAKWGGLVRGLNMAYGIAAVMIHAFIDGAQQRIIPFINSAALCGHVAFLIRAHRTPSAVSAHPAGIEHWRANDSVCRHFLIRS